MTGFGRAEQTVNGKSFLVDVKSLNGKQFDVRLMLPSVLKPYEFEVRNVLSSELQRGSVECVITLKQNGASRPVSINTELIKAYYEPVNKMAQELNLDTSSILSALLKLPEVVSPSSEALTEEEWKQFEGVLRNALKDLNEHRAGEGKKIADDLMSRIAKIEELQQEIKNIEPARRTKIKEGLQKVIEENVGKENYDPNRMEQEIIYYIEKIDISEEQQRLKSHCDYFRQIMNEKDMSKGKKLSFILQEIGREINTTGSKAYDSEVQKFVVLMKDELEKAKEQILNVL
jgi:uncharacterized protein (TIGR00255 family)